MSTHRFPWRGKIGLVGGCSELSSRIMAMVKERQQRRPEKPLYAALEIGPMSEQQVHDLPIAHRYSS